MKGAIIIEGHVQGLSNVRSLGERGIPIYVIDVCHCLAQYSRYCKKFFICPKFDSREFIDFLLDLGDRENLRDWVLIPSNDHIVENLSKNLDKISSFFKTLVPPYELLKSIINKKKLLEVAESCGVPIPKTYYIETKKDINSSSFPILIKGNYGLSFYKNMHVKALQIDCFDGFESILEDIEKKVSSDDIMIQELIPLDSKNKVVSFTCFADKGNIKTFWMGDKLREHPINYGTATFSRSIYVKQVYEYAKLLVARLGYTGVCEIEFMLDPRDKIYKLIEINPRTWLWVGLAKACGVDYAYFVYAYVNDLKVDYPLRYELDVKWINWVTDIVYGVKAIIKGNLSVSEYFKSLKGKKIRAIWSCRDIFPGIVFPFMLFYIAQKRR